jgi:hypothetical protein
MAAEYHYYDSQARSEWARARRKARWLKVLDNLGGDSTEGLLDFRMVAQRLNLKHAIYRGLHNIPLDQIVGSVGRYQDFNRAFLPAADSIRDRWQRIATLYLDPTSPGVPPIELYKVGTSYFVKDGNHRVSVARQLEMADIEAYVWEHPQPVSGLGREGGAEYDVDALLLEAERREFLDRTHLDTLRPGNDIRLTAPGGYPALLSEIDGYQRSLSQIDGQEVAYGEAVTDWYDLLYETTVQAIVESDVLRLFPERTVADFYVWIKAHHRQLEARYGRRVMLHDAARDFGKRRRPGLPSRTMRKLMRWAVQFLV